MSRFRGTIKGRADLVSRLGTKESGLKVTCAGWDGSVTVEASVDENGMDVFLISSKGDGAVCVNGRFKSDNPWPVIKGKS